MTPRGYHLGFTDDLLQQITKIHSNNPNKRIYLSGFSLGAGVVTKLLADLGEDAYRYNICGAAVNAVPFDASQSSANLNGKGITKSIYGDRLLKSMKKRIKQQFDNSCDFPFERSKIDECETIMDIENLAIAPVFGFDDAWDYYDKCKTIDILDKISVPQLIIQAKDDPFFKGMEFPANNLNFPLRIQYSELGGHCGFVCQTINEDNSQISWMPTQLGRFFAHVEVNYQSTSSNTEDATASLIVAK
jgi:predicted alpha/beta-fold hydrolase